MTDVEYAEAYESVKAYRENESKGSLFGDLSDNVVIVLSLLIIIILYLATFGVLPPSEAVGKKIEPNIALLGIGALFILLLWRQRSQKAVKYLLDERTAKAAVLHEMRWKQANSPGEIPRGQVIIDATCKFREMAVQGDDASGGTKRIPWYWLVGVKILDEDSREHYYGVQVFPYGSLIGTIKRFEPMPNGIDLDAHADWIVTSPEMYIFQKKLEQKGLLKGVI